MTAAKMPFLNISRFIVGPDQGHHLYLGDREPTAYAKYIVLITHDPVRGVQESVPER